VVEYALKSGLISVVAITVITGMGTSVSRLFSTINSGLHTARFDAPPTGPGGIFLRSGSQLRSRGRHARRGRLAEMPCRWHRFAHAPTCLVDAAGA
jgi:Flp pilus assembly pilin Flp